MIRAATLRAKEIFRRVAAETARRPKTVLILIWIVALVPMISPVSADGRSASGSCETLSTLPDLYRATGWAVLNAQGRPADCVLVAYHDPLLQEWIACSISDSIAMRPDIVKRFRSMDQLWAGWTASFSRSAIPADAQLSFWAVNADEAKLYRLEDNSSRRSP